MRRLAIVLLVAACGGKADPKPPTPTPVEAYCPTDCAKVLGDPKCALAGEDICVIQASSPSDVICSEAWTKAPLADGRSFTLCFDDQNSCQKWSCPP